MALPDLLIGALLVAAGATAGTPARAFLSAFVARHLGETLPWGTLIVNATGCAAIGVAFAVTHRHGLTDHARPWLLVAVGFLGSYTTVSSFALQTLTLARNGKHGAAVGYIGLSLALCLAAVVGGFAAAGGAP